MKKLLTLLLAVAMLVTCVSAALAEGYEVLNGFDPANFKSEKDPSEFKMAVVVKGVADWFSRLEEGVTEFAEKYGVDAHVEFPATTDAASQLEIIDQLKTQGYDAIIVVPNDSAALENTFADAMEKGIVVVGHEASNLKNCLYDTEAFNAQTNAVAKADALIEATGGEGKYAIMVGYTTAITHMDYATREVEYLKEKAPGLELINDGAIPTCESKESTTTAYEQAKQVLKANPDLKGFVCHCSTDAAGVSQAVEEMGLDGQVMIIGAGVPSVYAEELKDGLIYCVTTWDPKLSGYVACLTAYKVLIGEPVGDGTDLSDGGAAPGYEAVKLVLDDGNNCLLGSAPCVATGENVDELF